MAGNTEHTHGEMNIAEQVSTFHLIMGLTKWGSLATAAVILWLVLWFCTGAGFMGATITAIVLTVVGVFLLREKPAEAH